MPWQAVCKNMLKENIVARKCNKNLKYSGWIYTAQHPSSAQPVTFLAQTLI